MGVFDVVGGNKESERWAILSAQIYLKVRSLPNPHRETIGVTEDAYTPSATSIVEAAYKAQGVLCLGHSHFRLDQDWLTSLPV